MALERIVENVGRYVQGKLTDIVAFPLEMAVWIASPRFGRMVSVKEEDHFREGLENTLRQGRRLVGIVNHQGLGDGVALSVTTRHIVQVAQQMGFNIEGFIMPVAASLKSGGQGVLTQILYKAFTPNYERIGRVYSFPYTREEESKYGLRRTKETYLREVRAMRKGAASGLHVAVFAEGRVEGGRTNKETGRINGLVEVKKEVPIHFFELMANQGFSADFLPIGIDGSYRYFSADHRLPTGELLRGLLGGEVDPVISRIGDVIPLEEVSGLYGKPSKDNAEQVTKFLMGRVAGLLPDEAKGVYRNEVTQILN